MSDFVTGAAISIVVMIIHLFMTIVIASSVKFIQDTFKLSSLVALSVSLVWAYLLLSVALFASVGAWALLYFNLGLVPDLPDAFYSALVNYTTLGFGDLAQTAQTRLLGPMAAASGILMFSWAAAILVYILQLHLSDLLIKHKR